jgi:STE24 endopeptidase
VLLFELSKDELLAAVAHEAGHADEARWKGRLLAGGALLGFLFGVDILLRHAAARRWLGMEAPNDIRGLVLMVLAFIVAATVAKPLSAAVSRDHEARADRFGLELTQDPDAFLSLWAKAARVNKSDPTPPFWVKPFLDHPSVAERIAAVEEWKAVHVSQSQP